EGVDRAAIWGGRSGSEGADSAQTGPLRHVSEPERALVAEQHATHPAVPILGNIDIEETVPIEVGDGGRPPVEGNGKWLGHRLQLPVAVCKDHRRRRSFPVPD